MTSPTELARGFSPDAISWPIARSSDLFELAYGRALVSSDRRPGSVPVFGTNGRCGSHDEALFRGPGVILGRKGQGPLGVEWCADDYWVIDTAYSLRCLGGSVDPNYAYHLIKFVGLNHLKDGTSNPTLSRSSFGAQLFPIPPLADQRAIAGILGALDDKIELNRRTNETLEAMARAIFQSWFVDFDPVRAKMEGRQPEGMDAETAKLFPSSFASSDLGLVPEGWRVGMLAGHVDLMTGFPFQSDSFSREQGGVRLLRGANVAPGLPSWQDVAYWPEPLDARTERCLLETGDIVLAMDRPWIPAGLKLFVVSHADVPSLLVQRVARLRGGRLLPTTLLHAYLVDAAFTQHLLQVQTGSTIPHVSASQILSYAVVIPPAGVATAFDHIARPLFEARTDLRTQTTKLAALRDALLPKLLSGELRVPDAERAVADAL